MGDLLPELMARRGYSRSITQDKYLEAWRTAAGTLFDDSRPGILKRGVLEIVTRNSTVLQELSFQRRHLLKAICQLMPEQKIRDLRFVVGQID